MRGTSYELDDTLKERFLDLIAQGYTRPEAAAALDGSARQYRALCNPKSPNYDERFADQYAKLTEPGGEQKEGIAERLEDAALQRGLRSSDRLLEKLLVIHSPDWAVHRPQAMQINFNKTEQLAVILPEMSEEELLQLRQRIESNMRQIGPPDIDQDPK